MTSQRGALDQVATAVEATTIIADHGFAWFGKRPPRLPGRLLRALDPPVRRKYLVGALAEHLYSYFYVKGYPAPMHWEAADAGGRDSALVDRLRRANAGTGTWESGWQAVPSASASGTAYDAETHLDRDGIRLAVRNKALLTGGAPGPVSLRLPNEFPARSPGHYFALSDTPWTPGTDIVRVYWNCTTRGAVSLMADLTRALNREQVPFRFKVLDEPGSYHRCDAAVLYVGADDFARIRPHLARAQENSAAELHPASPVFTQPLAPGVSLAEDVDNGRSFGMHRCAALADGMVTAARAGGLHRNRLATVARHLDQAGISLATPHLRPGSERRYHPFAGASAPPAAASSTPQRRPLQPASFHDEALCIGAELLRSAQWDGDRCTWLGSVVPAGDNKVLATLGPTLYDGLAGVALVLAQLHAASGEPQYADTARAALRQALALDAAAAAGAAGLFDGSCGLALAAAHVGGMLDDAPLRAEARRLASSALERPGTQLDLISGVAGRILASLELARLLATPELVDAAALLGGTLIASATHAGDGLSWGTTNRSREYHLTGLSHGTAGVAMSLMELYGATGESSFREAAERGFGYERQWFDPGEGNWPDLRETQVSRSVGGGALAYSTYWCHGAPGIGISRIRAWQLTGDARYREEARTALATTKAFVAGIATTDGTDQSICHGQLGNAAVLAYGSLAVGVDFPGGADAAAGVAARGITHFGAGGRWPLGTPGWNPSLMLGTAGIAHVLLWLQDPTGPLVLIPGGAAAQPGFITT